MNRPEPEGLVNLVTANTAFQAHAIAAVLHDAGIEAFVFDSAYSGFGFPPPSEHGVPVRVPESALDEARTILEAARAESVDIDWDAIDVGEREDDLPLHQRRGVPLWVRIAIVIGGLLLLIGLFGWLVVMIF